MRVPARLDSRSLWLWAIAIVGAAALTWLELHLDPPTAGADHVVEIEVVE